MNKVVVILGIVVIITLGGLFFCAGFFTGTTIFPSASIDKDRAESVSKENSVSLSNEEASMDAKSATMSEKIMAILSSAAETASSSISDAVDSRKGTGSDTHESTKVTLDSLLREIVASHSTDDGCSPEKTKGFISFPAGRNPKSLRGKLVVFIGYFKNNIALEIQELLVGKGYRVHVEHSQTGENESFVFCGPFRKKLNATRLVKWLRKHEFSEARVVNVSEDALEETLYDALNDNAGPPNNAEREIPEMIEPAGVSSQLAAGVNPNATAPHMSQFVPQQQAVGTPGAAFPNSTPLTPAASEALMPPVMIPQPYR
ncbi:MAG: hypothetical protein LBS14_03210 [Holosporaceae bacterium]|jgi:cell division septation protein DedD|nr:hypothetical protein [Holosporaceae bacterium]